MSDAALLLNLPTGKALGVFVASLIIGAFVIFKYCLDQFDKPVENLDDRWNFLVPSQLTPHRQYILGFTIYYGLSMLIFLFVSFVGPQLFGEIANAVVGDGKLSDSKDHSTFPIIVAFTMVGLYPNIRPPLALDVEIWLRRVGHWMAYIPKNMVGLVNEMGFSGFDLTNDKVTNAWLLIDLKRPAIDAPDLKSIGPLLDRLVVLYVRGAALAGDLESHDVAVLRNDIDLDVFKEFHEKLTSVLVTIEDVQTRLEELGRLGGAERRQAIAGAQRDIRKSLDVLYVIFACAITGTGADRLEDRLRAIGFTSQFRSKQDIPWSPILKVVGLSAIVLLVALMMASQTFLKSNHYSNQIPSSKGDIMRQVVLIVVTLSLAIGNAIIIRTRLINQDRYFVDKPAAFAKIVIRCILVTLPFYLIIYLDGLIASGQLVYWVKQMIWSVVPATCGVLVAVTLDRPANSRFERATSGAILGTSLAIATWIVVTLNENNGERLWTYVVYNFIVYGGFGFVVGAALPAAIRRYRDAQLNQMPQRVAALYNEVGRFFYDYGQFNEWLHVRNPALDSKPPSDVLLEETGMDRLISFVSETRKPFIAPS